MKHQLTHLFVLFISIGLLISCKSDAKETNNNSDDTKNISTNPEEVKVGDNQDPDGHFAIKSGIITYETKKLNGTLTATNVLYFDDYGKKLKLEETISGEVSVYMFDEDKKKGLTSFPGRKPSKMFMRQGELNSLIAKHSTSGYTKQENETIAGKDCVVYANNAKSTEGESKHVYYKYKGILFKDINRLGSGYITEAISFEEKALDNSIFSALIDL